MRRKNLDVSQTIFALSSGRLPSAVAIVKLSGPEAFSIARRIFQLQGGAPFEKSRGMHFGSLKDLSGFELDKCILLGFVSPHSHTGEDTVEFHCHGSIAIISALERVLLDCGGRLAEKGEFSYRALLNGKMSPSELEVLGDVFVAREGADLRRIYSRRDHALEAQVRRLRSELVRVQAILDTAVDFADEYSDVASSADEVIQDVILECSVISQSYSRFRNVANVPRLVLAGKPNAGKSSLFNALLCRYRAIVHEEAGTTRDVIEEDIEVSGKSWKLVDTAGVRKGEGAAEIKGLELGADFLAGSSFWLLVVDGTVGLSSEESELLERFGQKPHAIIWNKNDRVDWKSAPGSLGEVFAVSALNGDNFGAFWEALRVQLLEAVPFDGGPLPSATQASKLEHVRNDLVELRKGLSQGVPPEFLAEKNRTVLNRLEEVVGEVGTEDVLDRVFNEFCIGK